MSQRTFAVLLHRCPRLRALSLSGGGRNPDFRKGGPQGIVSGLRVGFRLSHTFHGSPFAKELRITTHEGQTPLAGEHFQFPTEARQLAFAPPQKVR